MSCYTDHARGTEIPSLGQHDILELAAMVVYARASARLYTACFLLILMSIVLISGCCCPFLWLPLFLCIVSGDTNSKISYHILQSTSICMDKLGDLLSPAQAKQCTVDGPVTVESLLYITVSLLMSCIGPPAVPVY